MKCRSCDNNLTEVLSLGDQYLSDFRDDDILPPKYPLTLMFCGNCSLVQLKDTTPSELLYTDNYGFESHINGMIRADLKEIAQKAQKECILDRQIDIVLDIGSNTGELLKNYPTNIIRIGVDPIKKFKEPCLQYADYVADTFFSKEAVRQFTEKRIKIITAISCFYDIDDPNSFVADIKELLHKDGIFIIQQNYLGSMIENNAYDNISHEHLEYYSLTSLEYLLNKHDLEIFKVVQNTINGGSFRTYISHKGKRSISNSVKTMRYMEKKRKFDTIEPYEQFAKRISKLAEELHGLIKTLSEEGNRIYILGASTRGNIILQHSKLDNEMLPYAVERNPAKFGKKIASLQIPIISEEQAKLDDPEYYLILPYFFADEIIERSRTEKSKFIIPLSSVRVI